MNKKQIIKILQDNNITVEMFAYEDLPCKIEDYPEAVEAKKARTAWMKEARDEKGEWKDGYSWDAYNELPNEYDIALNLYKKALGIEWTEVEQYGGEGQGDDWYSIKYFPDFDLYLKINGYYQSYNGTEFYGEWNCVSEVKPVTKTVTVYE